MTQGRCDYVDSMFGGSPKQVNLLARAVRTPGACHSLPNGPLITVGEWQGAVSQTCRSANWQDVPSNFHCVLVQGTSFKIRVGVILMWRGGKGRRAR